MENTTGIVTITADEYRNLLTQAANYEMIKDVMKAGVKLGYAGELTIAGATIDVLLKYVLGDAYAPTIDALKAKED